MTFTAYNYRETYDYFVGTLFIKRVITTFEYDLLNDQVPGKFRNELFIYILLRKINNSTQDKNIQVRLREAFQRSIYYNSLGERWNELSKSIPIYWS